MSPAEGRKQAVSCILSSLGFTSHETGREEGGEGESCPQRPVSTHR